MSERLLAAQFPVLTWWAIAIVATRASSTLTLIAIFVVGVWLDMQGETTIGEIVAFMSLATGLIGRLEQIIGFVNFMFGAGAADPAILRRDGDAARASPTAPARSRSGGSTAMSASRASASPMAGSGAALRDVDFEAPAGRTVALVGAHRLGQVDDARAAASRLRSRARAHHHRRASTSAT